GLVLAGLIRVAPGDRTIDHPALKSRATIDAIGLVVEGHLALEAEGQIENIAAAIDALFALARRIAANPQNGGQGIDYARRQGIDDFRLCFRVLDRRFVRLGLARLTPANLEALLL